MKTTKLNVAKQYALIVSSGLLSMTFAHAGSMTDMIGHQVEWSGTTKKVVTIPMPASSLIMSLDKGTSHLIGMNPEAKKLMQQNILSHIFPQAATIRDDVTRSGFTPNVETLLTIQPDIVWQWGNMGNDLITPLKQAGLPVAALLYGDEQKTREWIRLMGISLGQEQEATRQLAWRAEVEKNIQQKTASLSQQQKPRVMYLARYSPQIRVAGKNTNLQHDITLAGGINVGQNMTGSTAVNVEQILAWNPDVILLNNFEKTLTPDSIYQNPLFADISAVKTHRVYKVPEGGYLWDPPNQESPLFWQWLSDLLHPELFQWPLRSLIKTAYQDLYHYTATDSDINRVLHTDLNQKALHYERYR